MRALHTNLENIYIYLVQKKIFVENRRQNVLDIFWVGLFLRGAPCRAVRESKSVFQMIRLCSPDLKGRFIFLPEHNDCKTNMYFLLNTPLLRGIFIKLRLSFG